MKKTKKIAATKTKASRPKPKTPARAAATPAKTAPPKPGPRPGAKPATEPAEPARPKLKLSRELVNHYRRMLLELRDHLIDGVNFLASDNLKRTHRDASGELSGYSLHMADAGTDNFDREFALSLVSSEQEGLYEIEEALKRLEQGTFGICDMCDKPIRKERLEAVPFARLCINCQATVEKDRRGQTQPTTMFGETADEEEEGEEGGE